MRSDEQQGDDGVPSGDDEEQGGGEAIADGPAAREKAAPGDRQQQRQRATSAGDEDELEQALQNGGGLGGSSGGASTEAMLLQMQASAMLSETRMDYASSESAALDSFLAKLKKALRGMPEQEIHGTQAAGFLRDLGFDPEQVTLSFLPPTSVAVVGSHALRTMARPETTVDVAVEIPDACLYKKAHLNYRYHARRALYLAAISLHLASLRSSASAFAHVRQELGAAGVHDPTRPALLLHVPSGSATHHGSTAPTAPQQLTHGGGLTVRLLPVVSPGLFAASKLAPDRNSVRWVAKPPPSQPPKQDSSQGGAAAPTPLPTPHYNAGILQDAATSCHHAFLSSRLAAAPRLADGVVLLKAWARQRGLLGRPGALDGHALTMLVVHLEQQGKLSSTMTPLQMLRCCLLALSDPAVGLPKGLAMARDEAASAPLRASCSAAAHPPAVATFRQHCDAVFVDFTGYVNLLAGMTKTALTQVASLAKQTLTLLQSTADPDEAFAAALLSRHTPASAYDYVWRVHLPPVAAAGKGPLGKSGKPAGKQAKAEGGETGVDSAEGGEAGHASGVVGDQVVWRDQEAKVESVVRQALTDRATLVRVLPRRLAAGQAPLEALREGLPAPEGSGEVAVAATVDPAQATRLVDVGPAADDARAAARFRAFWGSRSELRRFQDGRICEAVVWEGAAADRHRVPDRAVAAAASIHLPSGTTVSGCSGALDVVLAPQEAAGSRSRGGAGAVSAQGSASDAASAALASFRLVEAAVDKLGKQLRAIEGTALKVVGFQPISAVIRQTCPFFPLPHPLAGGAALGPGAQLPRCLEPIEVLVQLESSGRWPDDPVAFAKTKAALGLQLAASLEAGYGHKTIGSEECVDVLMDGFAFRLFFHSARDEAMLAKQQQQQQSPASLSASPPRPPPLVLSWHHGLVSAVAGVNPAYAPACRLAKRWVGCHMLSNHIADEAVELLVAAVFSGPSALPAPGSRTSGFLRFLHLLSSHPWRSRPLVIDPERQLDRAQRQQLLRTYSDRKTAAAKAGAAGAAAHGVPHMYLCTPRDPESRNWTHDRPSLPALQHASAMAARALRLLRSLTELGRLPSAGPSGSTTAAAAPGATEPSEAQWLAAFVPPLEQYDVLLLLRDEALPHAARALPGMPELLSPPSATSARAAKRASSSKRAAPGSASSSEPGAVALWSVRQPDALTSEDAEKDGPPPKRARAFLKAFPEQVSSSLGPAQLVPELLVGFDPIVRLLAALSERYGHLADFCADMHGGCRAVGVRWHAEAFLPSALKANTAHALLPCHLTLAPARGGPVPCVPNVVQVLAEIRELGQGLIEDVVTAPSCRRIGA